MKIVLCEDEPSQQQWMEAVLKEWQEVSANKAALLVYSSAEELLFKKEEWRDAGLLILDIELKEMNGMELARKIRETDAKVQLLFVTGYEKFVFEGYEVGAISYLMKPVAKEKLFAVLDKAAAQAGKQSRLLVAGHEEDSLRLYAEEICYIESQGHYCRIVLNDKELRVRGKISEFEEQLKEEAFCLCHRSYLVNVACIRRITKQEVVLDNGEAVPLARGKWEEANRQFMKLYRQ